MLIRMMLIGGGLVVLAGCGPTAFQTVAAAPLPETESCITAELLSLGDSIAFNRAPSGKAVTIVVPRGRWVESETQPTGLVAARRPTLTDPDARVQIDERPGIRRIATSRAMIWLAEDSTGSTSIRTKSPNLGTYREIAERCAVAQDSTEVGLGLDESSLHRTTSHR